MNAGIITHYDVHNHGALLQLTALIKVLETKGIEGKALRFDKNYDFLGSNLKSKYNISVQSIGVYLKYIKEKGLKCTYYNFWKRRTLNNYKKSKRLIGNFYSDSPLLDGVIVGSDEVFALHTGPTPVFFGYCLPTDTVVAYAGSFGPTKYEDVCKLHAEAFVSSGIASMKYVTVRDKNSAQVIKKLTGIETPIVVDPVLLYGFKKEIDNLTMPDISDFLLVYSYDNRMNSQEEVDAIKRYAKSRRLKTVSPGFYHSWCDYNIDVDPIKLLSYFKNAKVVVTDTFHGCVMSLITGAKFAVKTRTDNYFKLTNLLKEYKVENRIFTEWENFDSTLEQPLDYNNVNREIERRRNDSMCHLDNIISMMGNKL